jgi:hypothetical protein
MKARCYDDDHIPCVLDVDAYREAWTSWWVACQPSWRRGEGWPLPKEGVENATWGKLAARGKNGLFLVVMSTTWWAASLKSADQRHFFKEAVDDIRWVIEQQLKAPPVLDAPAVDKSTPSTSKPDSTAVPTWLQRERSKRLAKPSRRLLESMS